MALARLVPHNRQVGSRLPSFERGGRLRALIVRESVRDPAPNLWLTILGELAASVGRIEQAVDHQRLVELSGVDQALELERGVKDSPVSLAWGRACDVSTLAIESRESALGGAVSTVERLAGWRQRVRLR
jgi:hypothetical protein